MDRRIHSRLRDHPGYPTIQAIPGVGPVLAPVFVAEIGDISRFSSRGRLCSWASRPGTARPTPRCGEG